MKLKITKNCTLMMLAIISMTGCSSIMTHAGPNNTLYSGTKNNVDMLHDNETGWAMKPLVIIDMPFSALLDTLLLPYDYYTINNDKSENSPKERIKKLEVKTQDNKTEKEVLTK